MAGASTYCRAATGAENSLTAIKAIPLTLSRQNFTGRTVELDGGVHHFFYNMIFNLVPYEKSKVIPFVTGGVGTGSLRLERRGPCECSGPDRLRHRQPAALREALCLQLRLWCQSQGDLALWRASRLPPHLFRCAQLSVCRRNPATPTQIVLPIQGKLQMYEASAGIYFHFSRGF